MKKIFTSTLLILTINVFQISATVAPVSAEDTSMTPTIRITDSSLSENRRHQKPIKVKTTIITQKADAAEDTGVAEADTTLKKDKKDVELSSDVDKILKEMDIDDTDPLAEEQKSPVEKIYKPVKNNFMWIALSIIVFPLLLFFLLIKAMQTAKVRFEKEEKEKGLSKEEKLLDDLEKEQKKTKKRKRSLSEILGGGRQKPVENTAFEDDFDREEEDFEFMVEEVVLVEETDTPEPQKEEPAPKQEEQPQKAPEEPKPEPQPEQITEYQQENPEMNQTDNVLDTFEISDDLKFLIVKKESSNDLICKLNGREILVMKLEKAQKFNKVRKIDSKPGRDVYMVKLDGWRGLVEVKEDSAKYLMDI